MKSLEDPQALTEIRNRIARVQPDSSRQWGLMTSHQMICHLADANRVVMGEKPGAGPGTFMARTLIKCIALYLPMQWLKGVTTRPESDQMKLGTKPVAFDADKAELLRWIDRMSSTSRNFKFQSHPIFGVMTDWEWMRWAYLHCDHHLRQFGI